MKRKQFNFSDWVRKFRESSFSVNVVCFLKYDKEFDDYLPEVDYWEAHVSGNAIKGVFGDKNHPDEHIKNRFAADNVKYFDKIEHCPVNVELPCDFSKLLEKIDIIGSKDWNSISSTFDYNSNNPFFSR